MRPRIAYILLSIMALSGAGWAVDFNLTTSLLHAAPGSWIRRYAPNNHTITQLVVDVNENEVILRRLRHHDGHVVSDDTRTFTAEYIRKNGADPNSPRARKDRVEHKGKTFDVSIVEVEQENQSALFYVTDAIPAGGLLRIDLPGGSGSHATSLWTDEYDNEPDERILKVINREKK